ncbi:MAG TPA: hypothetical protein VK731_14605 [Candidatus Cybelea sp.]|nr:hypothetical protein [Candidatus Cybelea sp.]
MKPEWEYVLNETSLQFLLSCRSRDRGQLVDALEKLTREPMQRGDWVAEDETGRPIQIKRIGRFMVSFWADSFVKELRLIKIERIE